MIDEEKPNIEIPNNLLELFSDTNKSKFVEAKPKTQEIKPDNKMEEEDDDNKDNKNNKNKKDNKKQNPQKQPKQKKDDPEKLKRTLFVGNISCININLNIHY